MCLSMAVKSPERVLGQGMHRGYQWMVLRNTLGHRCGYVRVPEGHPWHGKGYDDVEAEVHGGLTFAEEDLPCGGDGPDSGYWVGFDTAHAFDAPDPELLKLEAQGLLLMAFREQFEASRKASHPNLEDFPGRQVDHVWTQAEVEAECQEVCDQAALAAEVAEFTLPDDGVVSPR